MPKYVITKDARDYFIELMTEKVISTLRERNFHTAKDQFELLEELAIYPVHVPDIKEQTEALK
tara:strand:+ start:695 stop:883 length:189 start_codon:yes stop_codon:yes gene_type:complete